MDLWSKGLGRLVLTLRLSDRSEMDLEEEALSVRGTMGAPVYWDYAVALRDDDVVDFLHFLQQPAVVRYMVTTEHRWKILRTALQGAIVFAWRILCHVLGVAGKTHTVAATAVEPAATHAAGASALSADVLDKLPEDIVQGLQEADDDE